jgi:hypothetical protein
VPGINDDVTISVGGNPTIQLASGTQSIHRLTSNNLLRVSGGSLQVAAGAQISANLTLAGGKIVGTTINETSPAVLVINSSTGKLDAVTVNGDIDLTQQSSARVTIYNGLTLNGRLSLGNTVGSTYGQVYFGDFSHAAGALSGTATIVLGGSGFNSINNDSNLTSTSGTLTIGAGVTIHGASGLLLEDWSTLHIDKAWSLRPGHTRNIVFSCGASFRIVNFGDATDPRGRNIHRTCGSEAAFSRPPFSSDNLALGTLRLRRPEA